MSAPPAKPAAAPRRVDGSMSLLVDMMNNTLDEAYAERAARKAGTLPEPDRRRTRRGRGSAAWGAVVVLLLGIVTGTAVAHVRDRAQATEGLRAELAAEVRERTAVSDRLEETAVALRAEVAATRDAALSADAAGRRAAERVQQLELAVAATPVTGPGLVVTVDDAPADAEPGTEARGGDTAEGRVLDRDLQDIVNGLWAAGAEAISVNDIRLSSRTAIRSAGEAVLVDFRPISPPYTIEAIGNPSRLEVGFVDGPSGRRLQTLSSFSGITYSVERADELRLPAATEPELRVAEPVGGPAGERPMGEGQ